jgi:CTP-dependent riboflavin kinase
LGIEQKIHTHVGISYPEKHGWWLNELESLGINTREESQLKDFKKTTELTTDVKQMFYEEYQKAFSESL